MQVAPSAMMVSLASWWMPSWAASLPAPPEPSSNFTKESFVAAVEKAKEYIRAGDCFQIVPSQRFSIPFALPPFAAITDDDFAPAFHAALDEARAHIAAIAGNAAEPTFANVIEALEHPERMLAEGLEGGG